MREIQQTNPGSNRCLPQVDLGHFLLGSIAVLVTVVATMLVATPAGAQDDEAEPNSVADELGTADFRTAPILGPGTYQDKIVSGSTLWYAVLYTNDQPYRFEADLPGVDLEAETELNLAVSFIGPTLDPLDNGQMLEGSASYTGGGTNLWYLAVRLETDGRVGVEHELVLDIEGVGSGRLELCDDLEDCTFDDELATLDTDLADAQAELVELPGVDAEEVLGAAIDALEERRNDTSSRLDEANASIADLCAPNDDCDELTDPGSTTPLWGLLVGGLVLFGGVGILGLALIRSR